MNQRGAAALQLHPSSVCGGAPAPTARARGPSRARPSRRGQSTRQAATALSCRWARARSRGKWQAVGTSCACTSGASRAGDHLGHGAARVFLRGRRHQRGTLVDWHLVAGRAISSRASAGLAPGHRTATLLLSYTLSQSCGRAFEPGKVIAVATQYGDWHWKCMPWLAYLPPRARAALRGARSYRARGDAEAAGRLTRRGARA